MAKDEGIKNLILVFGCHRYQDLSAPSVWAFFTLMQMMRRPDDRSICLPYDILALQHQDKTSKEPKLKDQQDAPQRAVVEEEKWDYLLKMHDHLERCWDASRPLILKYTRGKTFKQVRIETTSNMDDDLSDIEDRQPTAKDILLKWVKTKSQSNVYPKLLSAVVVFRWFTALSRCLLRSRAP